MQTFFVCCVCSFFYYYGCYYYCHNHHDHLINIILSLDFPSLSLSLSLPPFYPLSPSLPLGPSPSHYLSLSLSLPPFYPLSSSLPLVPSPSLSLSLPPSHFLCLSLSLVVFYSENLFSVISDIHVLSVLECNNHLFPSGIHSYINYSWLSLMLGWLKFWVFLVIHFLNIFL